DRLIAIKIVKFDLTGRRQPKICVLYLEKVSRKFRQLPSARQRSSIYKKGRQNLGISVLHGVDIQEKTGKGTFQTSAPAFVYGKSRAGNLCRNFQIQDSRLLPNFPMGSGLIIKLWRRAPTSDFDVIGRTLSGWPRRMGNIGYCQQHFALPRIQYRYLLVGLLNQLRNLLHLRNNRVRVLLFFLQTRNFVACFIALRFALLIGSDEFTPLFVQRAKSVQIKSDSAPSRHISEDVQVFPKVSEVMHGPKRIAYRPLRRKCSPAVLPVPQVK